MLTEQTASFWGIRGGVALNNSPVSSTIFAIVDIVTCPFFLYRPVSTNVIVSKDRVSLQRLKRPKSDERVQPYAHGRGGETEQVRLLIAFHPLALVKL